MYAYYSPLFPSTFFSALRRLTAGSAITPSDLAGMPSQPLATRRASAQNAVVPLATRRPNAKGLVVVLAKTRPPAERVPECRVKQLDLVENGPTTPIPSPTPSSTPSPTSVTASPQPHWCSESNAVSNNTSVSEHELCSRLVTALRAKAAAGHILTRAELQFLGISDEPSTALPAGRAARSSNGQAEPLPEPLPAGALSSQPAASHPVAPVAVLRRHTYYDVTYCMHELSALHVR